MSRGAEAIQIIRNEDRTVTGVWGPFTLKSAFQPIFRFNDGRLEIAAFEGLIRPFREGEGIYPPAFFRAVLPGERLHVEALTRTLHLVNAGTFLDPSAQLFINFDPSVYVDAEMARAALREMRRTLQDAAIDPRRIVCEVTEQKSSSEQALLAFVSVLRDHGFRIAVDDYGAEDSDMERVSALKPDIVKFDAQWITRLMDSRPGVALLSLMVRQFSARGIVVVFEGLEEGWQLEIAEEVGAPMVQGYVLARPEIAPTTFSVFTRAGSATAPSVPVAPQESTGAAADAKTVSSLPRPFGRRSAR